MAFVKKKKAKRNRTKKKIYKDRVGFTIEMIAFSLCAGLFLWGFFSLLVTDYPPQDELVYEECTFIRSERDASARSVRFNIYVEEYEMPLEIDNVVIDKADREALSRLKAGDKITVSRRDGKNNHDLYAMSHGETRILTYEDYLSEHEENNATGLGLTAVMSILSVFILIVAAVHYKLTGRTLPSRTSGGRLFR